MTRELSIVERNAYSEVLEVLKNMAKDEVDKVPEDMREMFEECSNKEHKFKYDFSKRMDEQDFLEDTKLILAILYRDYWATPEKRSELLKKDQYNREKVEIEKRIKYNPNNIFENRSNKKNDVEEIKENKEKEIKKVEKNEEKESVEMIEKNETFFNKIINKIKKICKK